MAIKTFTTGELLTSSDTNTYLANSGLVWIKSETVGSGVTSVPVTGAFSNTYDNYKITYTGGAGGSSQYLVVTLGSAVTNYFGSMFGAAYASNAFIGQGVNAGASFPYVGICTTSYTMFDCDLYGPNLSRSTLINAKWTFNLSGIGYSVFNGEQASNTQFTSFTVSSAAALTGGTINVYGYRKP